MHGLRDAVHVAAVTVPGKDEWMLHCQISSWGEDQCLAVPTGDVPGHDYALAPILYQLGLFLSNLRLPYECHRSGIRDW